MVYTDGVHMVATTVEELHVFAEKIGVHRCYFRNPRKKRHPHYDLMTMKVVEKAFDIGIQYATDKDIVIMCRQFYGERLK